jgi:GTP pyrophosphokinase
VFARAPNYLIKNIAAPLVPEKKRVIKQSSLKSGIEISGVDNLLTHLSRCCKPVPGDEIIGYVTLGHGVSIHRKDCANVIGKSILNPDRLIEVNWGSTAQLQYSVDFTIIANNSPTVLSDLTTTLTNDKVPVHSLMSQVDKKLESLLIHLTVDITRCDRGEAAIAEGEKVADLRNNI